MTPVGDKAVYRIRAIQDRTDKPKKYKATYELLDEGSQQILAVCELTGQATFDTQTISDQQNNQWHLQANRKVMPSSWVLSESSGGKTVVFDAKLLAKVINPLYRVVMTMLDANGQELYRVVDPRTNALDLMLAAGTTKWAIVKDDQPVANICTLKTEREPAKGFLGKVRSLLTLADYGIVSATNEHLLSPPVALATFLLNRELTDIRGT